VGAIVIVSPLSSGCQYLSLLSVFRDIQL